MTKATPAPFDIYVIKSSGLPLFAGCTQSDYCQLHMSQHELQAGFLAAIYSFSKETFTDSMIKTILYDDIQLNFKIDDEKNLIFVFVHPIDVNREMILELLEEARQRFLKRYEGLLDDDLINDEIFENFQQDLQELGIIQGKNIKSIKMMQDLQEHHAKQKPNLWKWIKSKFSGL